LWRLACLRAWLTEEQALHGKQAKAAQPQAKLSQEVLVHVVLAKRCAHFRRSGGSVWCLGNPDMT
jgi:hypothetical protein